MAPGSAVCGVTDLAFLEASGRRIFTATRRGRPFLTLKGNSKLGRSPGFSISHSFSLKMRHWRGSSGSGAPSAPGLEEAGTA
ncbi:hypothetical protein EYF80_008102 [Liparis tanakae]|uniref:Uncharacterized protein n=1 Tax=Liparis tanakae TaxID=230148 RepID=A0A4Z2IUY0_9TELE|nr:hypothetical protein EYF80_008102 [Liparis tanakae]